MIHDVLQSRRLVWNAMPRRECEVCDAPAIFIDLINFLENDFLSVSMKYPSF